MTGKDMDCFSDLIGQKLVEIFESSDFDNNDELHFVTESARYKLHHDQSCCESVGLEGGYGDLSSLIGATVIGATEETSSCGDDQWTFYKLETTKGFTTFRWFGTSNGYYSTDVSFSKYQGD